MDCEIIANWLRYYHNDLWLLILDVKEVVGL